MKFPRGYGYCMTFTMNIYLLVGMDASDYFVDFWNSSYKFANLGISY